MTEEEKKGLPQLVFKEIRADHVDGRLKVEFKVRPILEPYMEAVLARRRLAEAARPAAVITSERKTGLYVPNVETTRLVRDARGWLRLAV